MQGTMSYKGFVWPYNPKSITYSIAEAENTVLLPGGENRVEPIAQRPRVIKGEGFFYGTDAQRQMNRLEQIFLDKTSGVLFLPGRRPLHAWFTQLSVLEQVKRDTVGYAFLFTEDQGGYAPEQNTYASYTPVQRGETLFHVACRTGIPVEELGDLNSLPGCYGLAEGYQVKLK